MLTIFNKYLLAIVIPLCVIGNGYGQNRTSKKDSTYQFNILTQNQIDKYTTSLDNKAKEITKKLENTNSKALKAIKKQENKLRKKLFTLDSTLAKQLFDQPKEQLQLLTTKINQQKSKINELEKITTKSNEYLPLLDTFKTSLKFFDSKLTNYPLQQQVTKALSSIKGLEKELENAADIKNYVKQRKQELKTAFDKYGIGKELQALNKKAFYYGQQLNEYKQLLKDPKKLEERAIAELSRSPLFTNFMRQNSQLSNMFRMPDNFDTQQSIVGLQTRASVNQLITQRTGNITSSNTSSGGNPQQYLQQQAQQVQHELNVLKEKIQKFGGGNSNIDMPDFKPNNQKSKSFLRRIEYGIDVQTVKQNNLFPVTTDIGITVGYKLNDKSVVGIGVSYKMGWGKDFKNINITNEGIGLRSYVDIKLKSSLFISGGYEQNYMQRFGSIGNLYRLPQTSWRQSGLLGLTKKISITKKKITKVQILYDFLNKQNNIASPPLFFRIGWGR